MPNIYHHVRDYKEPYLGKNTALESLLRCTRIDLCRGLITVGNPSFLTWEAIRRYGFARAVCDSVLSKWGIVMTNLEVRSGNICRNIIFDSYVSDKKRIVSYNLGMAFAKLYAERIFEIPNLVHVEFLKKRGAIELHKPEGKKRSKEPDLVGIDLAGQWHVFEAKGVSGTESQLAGKIGEAKEQLAQVVSIHGDLPETRSACATFIGSHRVVSIIADPPSDLETRIEISREKYFEAYYSPFLVTEQSNVGFRQSQRIDGISVETIILERGPQRLAFGLETQVFERALDRIYDYPDSLRGRSRLYSQREDESYSIGPDGYFFQNLSKGA